MPDTEAEDACASCSRHEPVLVGEIVGQLVVEAGGTYVDGTLGGGGHARALLERAGPSARLIGIDRDASALDRARSTLAEFAERVTFVHGNFADIAALVCGAGAGGVRGVVLDLGVSSDQLDRPERGFSFRADGPLDMRMDVGTRATAADLVNALDEAALADLIFEFGEEHLSRRIARAIVRDRALSPIRTTGRLADVVERAVGGRRGRTHPATKTFQALRIAVNGEVENLKKGLAGALDVLAPNGRLAVISFHSLEDREVKRFALRHAGRGGAPEAETPGVRILTRKPVVPGDEESRRNPRARSAKLRVMERAAA